MKIKCAFFDFDDTIAHGDTIHKLLIYTFKKHPLSSWRYIKTAFFGLGHLLKLVPMEKVKTTILFPLDLFTQEELKVFYEEKVVPRDEVASYLNSNVVSMHTAEPDLESIFIKLTGEKWHGE